MKKSLLLSLLLLGSVDMFAGTNVPPIKGNITVAETLGAISAEARTVHTSIVSKIDHKKREITLKGEDGKENTFIAPLEIRNFAQIKKGDHVITEHNLAMSIQLLKHGMSETGTVVRELSDRAKLGEKPSASKMTTVTMRYNITKKDPQTQMITLEESGNSIEAKINKKEQLDVINVGDQVEVTQVDHLNIRVVTPKK